MVSSQVTGSSQVSAEEALAEALDRALDQRAEESARTNVVVTDISKVGKGWKAEASVVSSPRVKVKPKLQPEPVSTLKKKKKVETPILKADDEEEDEEKKKKREKELERRLEEEYAAAEAREQRREREERFESGITSLYLELLYEDLFYAIAPRFDFDAVHILDGTLWEEAGKNFPDVDLYKAAHSSNDAENNVEPTLSPKPGRRSVLAEELLNE